MKPKRTSVAKASSSSPPAMTFVLITLDHHLSGALDRACQTLKQQVPGLELCFHAASDWDKHPERLLQCQSDIAEGNLILCTMLFMEQHVQPIQQALQARRDHCDALICCMSAPEIMRLTRMGRFSMEGEASGIAGLLKRLRGKGSANKSVGANQLKMLRRLPRLLRFIPGTAQDVRAYFLVLQYWLAGSEPNLERLMQLLIHRYADNDRADLRQIPAPDAPIEYPEVGVYHPQSRQRIHTQIAQLPTSKKGSDKRPSIGLLLMRSYALAGNTQHYDAVIAALESRGLQVIPAFASGLDSRPAVKQFFMRDGEAIVEAVVSLTGFSLVGGPAYNDTDAAQALLAELDVPYLSVQALEFQSLEQWRESQFGLMPIEATMMVSIPELDGATGPMVFGGRSDNGVESERNMCADPERVDRLADRVARLVALRKTPVNQRKIACVLFNFPPNGGSAGTAAHLAVFESLFNTLVALKAEGYTVELPSSVDALRSQIIEGNASLFGSDANVHEQIAVDDHVRREKYLAEIEDQWGSAPGKHLTDGRSLFILGAEFGNVLVSLQPSMGYEGDPMRLLFEGGFAPTHAFSAFYRYLREDWSANAVLHFGTHGALEFMPGKQVGLSENCWPDRLIGDLPNFYLYAANNPSEGLIAKRRSAATLVSYLTPSLGRADLYRGFQALRESIDRWRTRDAASTAEHHQDLIELIREQALACDLLEEDSDWPATNAEDAIESLRCGLLEIEDSLIPFGLHVLGKTLSADEQAALLRALAQGSHSIDLSETVLAGLLEGMAADTLADDESLQALERDARLEMLNSLRNTVVHMSKDSEIPALLRALDGRFIPPVAGGDLLGSADILPTGRNIHGFDPFRLPSQFALREGQRQAEQLLARHQADGQSAPRSVALVLWGTDNLKSEGVAIAQALALIGAKPKFDSYGRISGAELIDLETLGRARVDVVTTLSGIFRDLLPLQTRLLAEASYLASEVDEPTAMNPIRANTLAWQAEHDCDFETAALRVFSNAEGTYGSNVNMLIDSGAWEDDGELAETFTRRKGHAYGRSGAVSARADLLTSLLGHVDLAYQNLDSVEIGVTTVDHYFDTLGGISRAVNRSRGDDVPVYIADYTTGSGRVRTLGEQVALETRTRMLNPKWYESMLEHGYEGVRAIETHVTNTVGWSATTGQVAPWVYQQLSETFILDEDMRNRLAALNPKAAAKVANRLLEAQERAYWDPDEQCLESLRQAGEDLEDWIEGISPEAVA